MARYLIGGFLAQHGAVHLWYVVMSQQLVKITPEMGWTGRSWALSGFLDDPARRMVATPLFTLAALAFAVAAAGLVADASWWRSATTIAAIFSSVVLILFWDGSPTMLVEKGMLGVILNLAILGVLFWLP